MPLITMGYNQHELDAAYQRGHAAGYSAALYVILDEVDRRLPNGAIMPRPATVNEVTALIVGRLSEAQAARAEVAWLRRWEAELRADPLFEQLQRARQELKDEQKQCAEFVRDLAHAQKELREEKAAHVAAVQTRDTRITELNGLVAQLTRTRLDPLEETEEADKETESENRPHAQITRLKTRPSDLSG
jgi:hypothetical protein